MQSVPLFPLGLAALQDPNSEHTGARGGGLQSTIAVSIIECLGRTPLKLKQPDFGGLYRLILPHGLTNDFKPSALNPKPSGTKKRRVQGLGYCWILHMGGQNYGPFLGP